MAARNGHPRSFRPSRWMYIDNSLQDRHSVVLSIGGIHTWVALRAITHISRLLRTTCVSVALEAKNCLKFLHLVLDILKGSLLPTRLGNKFQERADFAIC